MEAAEGYNSGEAENEKRTPFPPYHKVPNSIYEVGLNHFEIVVYGYLSRRMGRIGAAYPKLETICQETGIRAKGTVRKALRSLMRRGFIEMALPATHRSPARYKVHPFAVEAAAKALVLENQESGDPELGGEYPEQKGVKISQRSTPDEHRGEMRETSRGTREEPEGRILFKEESVKEEKGEYPELKEVHPVNLSGAPSPQGDSALVLSDESTPLVSPAPREIPSTQTSLLTKTNQHYYALAQSDREAFDEEAVRLFCSTPRPSLAEIRRAREQFYQQVTQGEAEVRAERIFELESAHL